MPSPTDTISDEAIAALTQTALELKTARALIARASREIGQSPSVIQANIDRIDGLISMYEAKIGQKIIYRAHRAARGAGAR